MTTTAPTEQEVRHLPTLDTAKITAAAAAWVEKQLADCADTLARATKAAKIADREATAAEEQRKHRDAAAYTLTLPPYRIRRGADVPGAIGCNRNRWKVIRERQAELIAQGAWVGPVEDAIHALPKLAEATARHALRAEKARRERDAEVQVLLNEGRSSAEVARLIGRDPSRVSHIKHAGDSAA